MEIYNINFTNSSSLALWLKQSMSDGRTCSYRKYLLPNQTTPRKQSLLRKSSKLENFFILRSANVTSRTQRKRPSPLRTCLTTSHRNYPHLWTLHSSSPVFCMSCLPYLNSFRHGKLVAIQLLLRWDLFNIFRSVLVQFLSSFFSRGFDSVYVVHPFSSIDTTTA